MTTRKKTTAADSNRGGYNYMRLFSDWELVDEDDRFVKDAACKKADPAIFFPETGVHKAHKEAVAICATCTVTKDCLRYAINNDIQYGVWGGLTPQQRMRSREEIIASLEAK